MPDTTFVAAPPVRQTTGIPGLDDILEGGFTPKRLYLLEGTPGSGKTTLALQWLLAGIKAGEPAVYVTLSESREEVEEMATSHGWSLEGLTICDAILPEQTVTPEEQFSVFHPTDLELSEATRQMLAAVEQTRARRIAIDSLSEMRLLAQNPYRHRQQVVALKRYFQRQGCTAMLVEDVGSREIDLHLQAIAHGVLQLEHRAPEFGTDRRRLRVLKLRGRNFTTGYHDFVLRQGGLEVFPRLVAAEHRREASVGRLKSGIRELDDLLGGGPRRGTSTLITGPAGTGKSTLAQRFAVSAAEAGEHAVIFALEESVPTLLSRTDNIGLKLRPQLEAGRIRIEPIDPGQLSPGEFAARVRGAVEGRDGRGASVVVIDSINGYLHAMPEEHFLIIQLHELMTYLGQQGVVTFLIMAQQGLIGAGIAGPIETTYLTDNALVLRYFEAAGEIKTAITAMKMRSAPHEHTIREYRLGPPNGIRLGGPLHEFQGVLTGEPTFVGRQEALLKDRK